MTASISSQNLMPDDHSSAGAGNRQLQDVARDLIVNGSIEIREFQTGTVKRGRELLPFGLRVYNRSLHDQNIETSLAHIKTLSQAGFDPVPHIAARWARSRNELLDFLTDAVHGCGVSKVLLVGGDITDVKGPYADASAVLRDGVLETAGIREVGLAAYPEGHERIPREQLTGILIDKLKLARGIGLGTYIVTQFSFVPARVVDFCALLSRLVPDTPVYAGIAGPTDPDRLARYAKLCGVSASIRALADQGFKTAKFLSNTDPGVQLEAIARYCAARDACNVAGIHVYCFGGFIKSSKWMHRMYSN